MKSDFLRRLALAPCVTKKDIALTLLPALMWYAGVHSRNAVIKTHCVTRPESCTQESIPTMDRFLVGMEDPRADYDSMLTQNIAVATGLGIPWVIHGALALAGSVTPAGAALGAATDLVLVLQTYAWNGVATEATRLVVQRPRPFVYADPSRGTMASNYTAFVSGHTSGAAAGMSSAFFVLLSRSAPGWVLAIFAASGYALVSMTGVYRMLAGRHFLSDVICGAWVGFAVALLVAYYHRKEPDSPSSSAGF